jgi:membrane protein implicated in regulation of membrane protease activity
MHLMILVLLLPLLGLVLFFVMPLSEALPTYAAVLAVSAFFYFLMVRALKRARHTNPFKLVGEKAEVLNWRDGTGQVVCLGTIWEARSSEGRDFGRGDKVVVAGVEGLVLRVKPLEAAGP